MCPEPQAGQLTNLHRSPGRSNLLYVIAFYALFRRIQKTLVCHGSRSPGDSTIVAAPGTRFPSTRSYRYALLSKRTLGTTTTALSSRSPVSNAG